MAIPQDVSLSVPDSTLGMRNLRTSSTILGIGGAAMSAIGAFYQAHAARYQTKAQALDLEFQGTIADINARAAEREAHEIQRAGQREAGRSSLRFGQLRGEVTARQGASGTTIGVGSNQQVLDSIDFAKELDSFIITTNALRAAQARRAGAVGLRNQGTLARVSAGNLRRSARSIRPGLAHVQSSLASAGPAIDREIRNRRLG